MRLVRWLLVAPFRLVRLGVVAAFRIGLGLGSAPVRLTAGVGRRVGTVGLLSFLAGVGVGVVLAPSSGAQLRSRLRTLVAGEQRPRDAAVAQAVLDELAVAPQTWQLPRPSVEVVGGVVTLSGHQPSEANRLAVEATASGVAGVRGVVNNLAVVASNGANGDRD